MLFDDLMLTVGQRFRRPEPRRRVCDLVRGLLAPLPPKNCSTIAVRFATKPQMASRMIAAAVTAGLPCRRVAGDEAYGNDARLAAQLRRLRLGYVLAGAGFGATPD
ncbi:transposase [Micromonospora sp. CPCC 205546]|uniref:transposase n=1 Tax=Micromonospora sp. CPCC 205546 TaxID=3122397 RepID=UPI003FA60D9C